MTGAWHLGLFCPFLGSVNYWFACYMPDSKNLAHRALNSNNPTELGISWRSPNQKACTRCTSEYLLYYIQWHWQQNHHFLTGFLAGEDPGRRINMLPIFPKTIPIQNLFNPPVILCQPPLSLPTCLCRDLKDCRISGACGEAITNGFWILDERAWQLLQLFWGKQWEARSLSPSPVLTVWSCISHCHPCVQISPAPNKAW